MRAYHIVRITGLLASMGASFSLEVADEEEVGAEAEADAEEALAHNHHINWTKESVKKFNDHGWLTFMFIRNPKDIMCSLFFWARGQWDRWEREDKSALDLREPLKQELIYISNFIHHLQDDEGLDEEVSQHYILQMLLLLSSI